MSYSQADLDNHANQLNPDHYEYWHCREQPAHTHYTDSSDEDSYSSGENKYWFSEQEIIDEYATIIQKWWQCVKKYPENNICKYRMDEALQTFHSIRKNKANIVKITKMLESLHLETSQLEEKFMNELKSRETYPFRKISKAFWDLPREGTVAWGERLIKEWSLRRYCYSTFHEEWMKKVWYMHDYDYYCDCTDYPGYEPRIIKCRRKYGDGWHLKYLKTKHT